MARKKTEVATLISKNEVTEAFASYANADAEVAQINAALDVEINKLREAKAARLLELETLKGGQFAIMKAYAVGNKEAFKKKRSMDFSFGKIGFRTGTPSLRLPKGFKWEDALKMVKEKLPAYVRTAEEVAKDLLINDRDKPEVKLHLEYCRISVGQTETFFVEPKKEEVANG